MSHISPQFQRTPVLFQRKLLKSVNDPDKRSLNFSSKFSQLEVLHIFQISMLLTGEKRLAKYSSSHFGQPEQ